MIYKLVKRVNRYDLYNSEGHKIASTNGYPKVDYTLSVRNCEAIELGYDFDGFLDAELNKLPYTKHLDDGQFNDGQLAGFELGARWAFQKALELMDIKFKTPSEALFASMALRYRHDFGILNENEKKGTLIIMSQIWEEVVGKGFFRGQTEWDVEIEMESNLHIGEVVDESYPKDFPTLKPKFSRYGFLILKRV